MNLEDLIPCKLWWRCILTAAAAFGIKSELFQQEDSDYLWQLGLESLERENFVLWPSKPGRGRTQSRSLFETNKIVFSTDSALFDIGDVERRTLSKTFIVNRLRIWAMHLQIQLHITHFLKIFLKKYTRSAALLNYIIHFVINFKKCWKYISCHMVELPTIPSGEGTTTAAVSFTKYTFMKEV